MKRGPGRDERLFCRNFGNHLFGNPAREFDVARFQPGGRYNLCRGRQATVIVGLKTRNIQPRQRGMERTVDSITFPAITQRVSTKSTNRLESGNERF